MTTITCTPINEPSASKGWNRYQLSCDGRRVVESATGNAWVSSEKSGQAEAGATIPDAANAGRFEGIEGPRLLVLDERTFDGVSIEHATLDTAADDPAQLYYTSGTTGLAKGIVHAHRYLLGHEEFDYCLRLRQAGYDLAVARDVFVRHHGHKSFRSFAAMAEASRRNRDIFLDKWCRQALSFLDDVNPAAAGAP